jgi:hypothetical protein
VVPFSVEWTAKNNDSESVMLWIVSANVHYSSKNLDHRREKFKSTYRDLVDLQAQQKVTCAKKEKTAHHFFSYMAGDFNSRVFDVKDDPVKMLVPSGTKSQDLIANVSMCLMLQRQFARSLLNGINEATKEYQKKCHQIYKDYLNSIEEFRPSLVDDLTKIAWNDEPKVSPSYQQLVEPKLQGSNIPTFVYNVYPGQTDGIDHLTTFISELNNDKSTLNEQIETAKDPFRTLFDYIPEQNQNFKEQKKFDSSQYEIIINGTLDSIEKKTINANIQSYCTSKNSPISTNINSAEQSQQTNKMTEEKGDKAAISPEDIRIELVSSMAHALEFKLRQTPAWCDRLMYLKDPTAKDAVQSAQYSAHHDIRISDHVPVSFSAVVGKFEPEQKSESNSEFVVPSADSLKTEFVDVRIKLEKIQEFVKSMNLKRERLIL